jgi:2-methylisocitrate lyase-like PEP mutase family enzyme
MTQKEKADRFQALHHGKDVLLFPNPWDGGSARLLENLGYRALGHLQRCVRGNAGPT